MARIISRSKLFIPFVAASFAFCAVSAAQADCLTPGGNAALDGWLSLKPATPEQVAGGLAKGSHWSIKLAKPACVATEATNPAIDSVPRVALKVGADQDKAFRERFNKRVKVTGVLHVEGQQVLLDGVTLAQ